MVYMEVKHQTIKRLQNFYDIKCDLNCDGCQVLDVTSCHWQTDGIKMQNLTEF